MRRKRTQLKVYDMSKKIHRFFVPLVREEKIVKITDHNTLHHMVRVLQLNTGEKIDVVENGMVVTIEITALDTKSLSGTIIHEEMGTKPKRSVTLALAVIKKDNFELVVSKASELGVAHIFPLLTTRTIKKELRASRLRDIAREAIEQSGQTVIPEIHEPQTLEEFLKQMTGEVWVGVPHATELLMPTQDTVTIIVGPEGGLTDDEVSKILKAGGRTFGLTQTILKAETAAIVATYQALV